MSALALSKQGIPVVLCEAAPGLAHDLRAGSFHPPTLEMMAPYGITERMMEIVIAVRYWQIRDRTGGLVAEFDLGLLGDDTPYPHRLHLEQHRMTPIMLELLRKEASAQIRFGHAVTGVQHLGDRVRVRLETEAEPTSIDASWLIGADG